MRGHSTTAVNVSGDEETGDGGVELSTWEAPKVELAEGTRGGWWWLKAASRAGCWAWHSSQVSPVQPFTRP